MVCDPDYENIQTTPIDSNSSIAIDDFTVIMVNIKKKPTKIIKIH